MRSPKSVNALEALGRVRLSKSFFMRDFLYSEIANHYGVPNVPENPNLAIETGTRLCEDLLEPLQLTFGRVAIRSAYRSPTINALGNDKGDNCGSNKSNYAGHLPGAEAIVHLLNTLAQLVQHTGGLQWRCAGFRKFL